MQTTIDKIVIKDRGRKEFKQSDIMSLAESIKRHGFLHPIVVSETDDGKFELIAGERRYRACIFAGITTIPITLKEDTTDVSRKEMELEENVRRVDLSWIEQVQMLKRLNDLRRQQQGSAKSGTTDESGYSQTKLANDLGRSIGSVNQDLELAEMLTDNPDVKEKVVHLPKTAAFKRAKLLLKDKQLEKLAEDRQIDLSIDFQLGDCLAGVKALDENSVDLLIMDPPYACDNLTDAASGKRHYGDNETHMGQFEQTSILLESVFKELRRVLKPGAHMYTFFAMGDWYCNMRNLMLNAGFELDNMPIIWNKGMPTLGMSQYHYMPCYESVMFSINPPRGRVILKPVMNVVNISPVGKTERVHPFQKPYDLLRLFINNSSNIGDVVLDCFAGSGSTLDACRRTRRKAIGFEIDKPTYLRAEEWLARKQ
jgi:ParB/RepB/Spo0J family partition protein